MKTLVAMVTLFALHLPLYAEDAATFGVRDGNAIGGRSSKVERRAENAEVLVRVQPVTSSPGAAASLFAPAAGRASFDANGSGVAGFSAPLDFVPMRVGLWESFSRWDHAAAFAQIDGYISLATFGAQHAQGSHIVAHGWLSLGSTFNGLGLVGETGVRIALASPDYAGGFYIEAGKVHNGDWFIGFGATVCGCIEGDWFGRASFTPRFMFGRSFERWGDKTVFLGQPLIDARIEYRVARNLFIGVGWSYWPDVQDERPIEYQRGGLGEAVRAWGAALARMGEWTTFYVSLEWRLP